MTQYDLLILMLMLSISYSRYWKVISGEKILRYLMKNYFNFLLIEKVIVINICYMTIYTLFSDL